MKTIAGESSNNEHQAVRGRGEAAIKVYASKAMFIVPHGL